MYAPPKDLPTAYKEYLALRETFPEYSHLAPFTIQQFEKYFQYCQSVRDMRLYTQDIDKDRPKTNTFNARIRS